MTDVFCCAEMDSPISIENIYPYGRRRTGAKVVAGAVAQLTNDMCLLLFITRQMYKLY